MSQENGLFSHDTIPIEVYTAAESSDVHHRPVFSGADNAPVPSDDATAGGSKDA